jgi:uncharacterized membrane protein
MNDFVGIGGLIVLALTIWAIVGTVSSGASTGKKVFWILFVLILPIIGFICWLLFGPRGAKA